MECAHEVFPIILYTLGSLAIIVLMFVLIKLYQVLSNINKLIIDINNKSSQLDGVFDIVEQSSSLVSGIGEKVFNFVGNIINTRFNKNKEDDINE